MKRFIIDTLLNWKTTINHKPLIIRGARQVGKTWAIKTFGEQHFTGRIHLVDLEKQSDWHKIFDQNLDVKRIISEFELVLNRSIVPGEDLLFFDEIQSCPRAIMSLRYFYEEMPELHVIAAGSLLEFALKDISFPVGRIQFLDMYPLSFREFLWAVGKDYLANVLQTKPGEMGENAHLLLLENLRLYFFIGGMPQCVKTYRDTGKLINVSEIQTQLIETFRADFSKYAPYADKHCLNIVLTQVARKVGSQIKYSRLSNGFTPPTNKKAFDLLTMARVIYKIPAVAPIGLPLGATASNSKFKALMVDIGLMQNLCGLNISEELYNKDLLAIYRGALAEQFVGQEIMAEIGSTLWYWSRNAKSSTAEVDFIFQNRGKIIPIEVKSGSAGRLRSMHILLENYPDIPNGYVLSERPFAELRKQRLVFYPLYSAGFLAADLD